MDKCPLTDAETTFYKDPSGKPIIYYSTPLTGQVRMTIQASISLSRQSTLSKGDRFVLAGLMRLEKLDLITDEVLRNFQDLGFPRDFQQKAHAFLKFVYDIGGKEFKIQNFNSCSDCTLAYAPPEVFESIIKFLITYDKLIIQKTIPTSTCTFYNGLSMTKAGIEEVEKNIPNIPLYAIVDQTIYTGNTSVDEKLALARELYFHTQSLEGKRAACETLSTILEPLRDKLKMEIDEDTERFFEIVNKMKIRHNKPGTAKINHVEIYDWIYFGLLNTINTYYRLLHKINQ